MFVRIVGVNLHKILLVGSVESHLTRFAVGVFLYGLKHLCATRDIENLMYFIKCLVSDLAECPCTLLAIDGSELAIDLLIVIYNPLPDSTLFGV